MDLTTQNAVAYLMLDVIPSKGGMLAFDEITRQIKQPLPGAHPLKCSTPFFDLPLHDIHAEMLAVADAIDQAAEGIAADIGPSRLTTDQVKRLCRDAAGTIARGAMLATRQHEPRFPLRTGFRMGDVMDAIRRGAAHVDIALYQKACHPR